MKKVFSIKMLIVLLMTILVSNCSFKKLAPETPPESETAFHKNFFFNSKDPSSFSMDGAIPKTFVCGWAPEKISGDWSPFYNYNYASHCNVQFRILEEGSMVGFLVNPSQNELEWKAILKIPIKRHFYKESRKDQYGRELNETIEEGSRSHWSARPFMELDLKNIRVMESNYEMFWGGLNSYGLSHLEKVKEEGFLGFTIHANDATYGTKSGGSFRFNFLEFKHDENFERTPYHKNNSSHFNVLHILGRKPEKSNKPYLYAGKWDLGKIDSKNKRIINPKKHIIRINRFPKEYESIGLEVIKLWNDQFEKVFLETHGIKGVRPFEAKVENLKHAFDLRKPAITWVEDVVMSDGAPLGVGMVTTDVYNGKILWGGVTIWGGTLKGYLNTYKSSSSLSSSIMGYDGLKEPQTGLLYEKIDLMGLNINAFENKSNQMPAFDRLSWKSFLEDSRLDELKTKYADNYKIKNKGTSENLEEALQNIKLEKGEQRLIDKILSEMSEVSEHQKNVKENKRKMMQKSFFESLYNIPKMDQSISELMSLPSIQAKKEKADALPVSSNSSAKNFSDFANSMMESQYESAGVFDSDRTVSDVIPEMASGLSIITSKGVLTHREAMKSIIKDLILHEVGHIIGLGHNFKENIIPEKGTVPESIRQELESYNNEEKHYIQASTVMGYKSGYTAAATPPKYIKPGPHDALVLSYLYAKKVSTYKHGDLQSNKFRFIDLPIDGDVGTIPDKKDDGEYYTSYFPHCNNFTAAVGSDPYCRRWDRGGDAVSLVQNKFRFLKARLVQDLYAFSDSLDKVSHRGRERYLGHKAFRAFQQSRVFYDYMRQKYDKHIMPEISKGVDGERHLLEFSTACRFHENEIPNVKFENDTDGEQKKRYELHLTSAQKNETLKNLFHKYPELRKLCVATGIMMKEIKDILELNGKDYSIIDYNSHYTTSAVAGGDINPYKDLSTGAELGRWTEIGKRPLKMEAIKALTLPFPIRKWYWFQFPMQRYAGGDGNYHLSTFYPNEYNDAVRGAIDKNLNFSTIENSDSTTMNKTVIDLGAALLWTYASNDMKKLTGLTEYINNIRRQTEYKFSLTAVIVDKVENLEDQDIAKELSAKIYNIDTGEKEPLTEVFLTEKYNIIARPPIDSFLYPITKFRIFNETSGYYLAYRLDYNREYGDALIGSSVKLKLLSKYKDSLTSCLNGLDNNGLRYFFKKSNKDEYQGIFWPKPVYRDQGLSDNHRRSIEQAYYKYYNSEKFPGARAETCREAIRGMGLIANTAGILNGYWLNLTDYFDIEFRW